MKTTALAVTTIAALFVATNAQTITASSGQLDVSQVGDLLSGTTTDLSQDAHQQNGHVAFYEGLTILGSTLVTNTGNIASGTAVNSTYFHFDSTVNSSSSGSATFSNPILALIWSNGLSGSAVNLNPSNGSVGVSGVTYSTKVEAGTLEYPSDVSLTFSGNTVTWVDLNVAPSFTDNFRVLTVPEPSGTALLAFGALGFLARRKR